MFSRIGAVAYKKDLHNTIALCDALDNPQTKFKSIHIAGTNGKGSTSHMLAAILQQAGYKTGLYTSPHLKDFRERIRINGDMVSKKFVSQFVQQQKAVIVALQPSFFEVTVAMAFSYFAQEKLDIAVIEVGLGGRLDSTNIITPELSVVTNISLDHTNLLGNTLPEIAFEKAGIIKRDIPVVIGERQAETDDVFVKKAEQTGSQITFAADGLRITQTGKDSRYLSLSVHEGSAVLFENLQLDLTGSYQLKNVLTVIQSVIELRKLGYNIPDKAVYKALKNVKNLTGLQGRWYTLQQQPLTICDTGHNLAGITEVMQNIKDTPYKNLHMVIGVLKDKDISGVLALLPPQATYYFTQPQVERALPVAELAEKAGAFNLQGDSYPEVKLAWAAAKQNALPGDLIFIGGSTFVVAEVI